MQTHATYTLVVFLRYEAHEVKNLLSPLYIGDFYKRSGSATA
jgi:hypothetical protein